jgi:transposase
MVTLKGEPPMEGISTIGLDIAKHVFQVHGVDGAGATVLRRKLRRNEMLSFFSRLPACVIGIETCATSHHWARQLRAFGHDVRLMPASYVKPYVKRQKNDAADAEAICEAVTRPTMQFVPIKSEEQQGVLMLHRTRELMIRQRTMMINALRAHLAELGIIARQGNVGVKLLTDLVESEDDSLPAMVRTALLPLTRQLDAVDARIAALDREILSWHRSNEASRRLETIPGVGPITASAIVATITDASLFRSGRHLSAWLGLVPRQNSSGGKERLGRITKKGDPYIRRLLVVGALSALRVSRKTGAKSIPGAASLSERKPYKLAAIAVANKMARIVWALLTSGERFRPQVSA